MPDLTPRPLRSKANGIINFMGGLGSVVTFLAAGFLFSLDNELYPFAAGSIIMIITVIVMYNLIHEPKEIEEEIKTVEDDQSEGYEKGRKLSLLFLLLAIFFWFTGFNAIETFFSTYGSVVLNINLSQTSFLLAVFSGLFLLFAIPSGFIATKFGRKKVILTGLIILLGVFISLIFIRDVPVIYPVLAVGGISWALININSYPMVVEMTSSKGIGKYTGYYYFFSMLAAIVSPILCGFLKDKLGDSFLFIYASIAIIFAFFFMMLVKHGEAKVQPKSALENIEYMES
jgi:MFS family permease